jgi:hypothetical protein
MYLFFDTETTGIPRNYRAPASDLRNWPRLVQVAWLLADEQAKEIASAQFIVKPEGFTIPPDSRHHHRDSVAERRRSQDRPRRDRAGHRQGIRTRRP